LESGRSFEVIIRKAKSEAGEDTYRLTVFRKIDIEEVYFLPEVIEIIEGKVVRIEKVDNYRFDLSVRQS
jgi:hypothetical protein